MLQKTPAEQENGLSSIIRTFDPDVPGLRLLAGHVDAHHVPSAGAARQIARSRDESSHWGGNVTEHAEGFVGR
jgi:hypothetical protein